MNTTRAPDRFASLFVELTGTATIEEHQEHGTDHQLGDADYELGAYLAKTTRQTGLEDAIDAAEDY